MILGPQQAEGVKKLRAWLAGETNQQVFRLFGYAGTGKTTLITHALEEFEGHVEYVALTGKAASVMQAKGIPTARTIHSLIYKLVNDPNVDEEPEFVRTSGRMSRKTKLIVVEEASMVDIETTRDLLQFGIPVLAIGDPAQLPPVDGPSGFTNVPPDVQLTQIYRQGNGNPIIQMATAVRKGQGLSYGVYGQSRIVDSREITNEDLWSADQVLCGTNDMKDKLNRRARNHFGITEPIPVFGDKVVCTRTNYGLGIRKGETYMVVQVEPTNLPHVVKMDLVDAEHPQKAAKEGALVHVANFRDVDATVAENIGKNPFLYLDFGYAITVHKAQGSQWNNVVLIDESRVFRADRYKWLYTGITRAAEKITIVKV